MLDKQIKAIKEIYKEFDKAKVKHKPIIVGKFALTVYTQGLYPANIISLLYPDLPLLENVLSNLGYQKFGDLWLKDDINVEVSKDFYLLTGTLNQIEVDKEEIFNVLSLEDLILDMMKHCVEGDDLVCELVKMIVKSYYKAIDFHYLYQRITDRRFIPRIKEFKKEAEA
ncbi:6-carboxyhexanoate--CoA ligase [Sulfurihydrogenibium sp.]|uniref:6-carboxyhexanoate--CoA ligase n=1 Tax=Sulfurihydrogenibium sp. TaxID=2053621 RepID=UPI002631CEC3|nr:6-carboxyhexanoate--CoA ligase [Sulfurihydrogenibium sp.]